jgi:STE24 endopeptidase
MSHPAALFGAVFLAALVASVVLHLWLARRQMQHVRAHRDAVPAHFAGKITLEAHQKAADYTVARTRVSIVDTLLDTAVLLALTLGGGVALLAGASTAPPHRNLGAQSALLEARLRFAADRGCDLAMICALPGSASQRNAERRGFRIAYTRMKFGR